MELVTPGIGLLFWMTVSFVILLIILRKFAWKPVLEMLKNREESIENALNDAEKARQEAVELNEQHKVLLKQNNEKYLAMLSEIQRIRTQKMQEVKDEAHQKMEQCRRETQESIQNERQLAFDELKKDMAVISVEIASKILREQLKSDEKSAEFAQKLVDEMKLN
ncbi:MAG: F0F1 ATP synthase subunit B [Bacteroidales bacterium]|nr:F0F1 ATP synthase subunit B [Bacteroidales bacterium]